MDHGGNKRHVELVLLDAGAGDLVVEELLPAPVLPGHPIVGFAEGVLVVLPSVGVLLGESLLPGNPKTLLLL